MPKRGVNDLTHLCIIQGLHQQIKQLIPAKRTKVPPNFLVIAVTWGKNHKMKRTMTRRDTSLNFPKPFTNQILFSV